MAQYVDSLEERGRLVFLRSIAIEELKLSKNAFKLAARRLIAKKRIVGTKGGFFVAVPLQYRSIGSPPPSWFIHDLMEFHHKPYYVGILSAAEMHGAAHQRPQVFQVITDSPTRTLKKGGMPIRFFTKKHIHDIPVQEIKTEAGFIHVSTPEATAVDVVRYYKAAGYFDNVTTVLIELAEVLDSKKLVRAVTVNGELSIAQRLGYLLDRYTKKHLTLGLEKWVRKQNPFPVLLDPTSRSKTKRLNTKWNVMVNTEIEPDV